MAWVSPLVPTALDKFKFLDYFWKYDVRSFACSSTVHLLLGSACVRLQLTCDSWHSLNATMLSTMDTVAALAAVFVAGTLLSRLASWIRYHFKIRKIPLAHNLGLLDRIFTRKATEEFAVDFKNLSRKGLAKVNVLHLIEI